MNATLLRLWTTLGVVAVTSSACAMPCDHRHACHCSSTSPSATTIVNVLPAQGTATVSTTTPGAHAGVASSAHAGVASNAPRCISVTRSSGDGASVAIAPVQGSSVCIATSPSGAQSNTVTWNCGEARSSSSAGASCGSSSGPIALAPACPPSSASGQGTCDTTARAPRALAVHALPVRRSNGVIAPLPAFAAPAQAEPQTTPAPAPDRVRSLLSRVRETPAPAPAQSADDADVELFEVVAPGAPAAPCAPVAPVAPCAPNSQSAPCAPCPPCAPAAPCPPPSGELGMIRGQQRSPFGVAALEPLAVEMPPIDDFTFEMPQLADTTFEMPEIEDLAIDMPQLADDADATAPLAVDLESGDWAQLDDDTREEIEEAVRDAAECARDAAEEASEALAEAREAAQEQMESWKESAGEWRAQWQDHAQDFAERAREMQTRVQEQVARVQERAREVQQRAVERAQQARNSALQRSKEARARSEEHKRSAEKRASELLERTRAHERHVVDGAHAGEDLSERIARLEGATGGDASEREHLSLEERVRALERRLAGQNDLHRAQRTDDEGLAKVRALAERDAQRVYARGQAAAKRGEERAQKAARAYTLDGDGRLRALAPSQNGKAWKWVAPGEGQPKAKRATSADEARLQEQIEERLGALREQMESLRVRMESLRKEMADSESND